MIRNTVRPQAHLTTLLSAALACALALHLTAQGAKAAVQVFTSRAAWEQAVGGTIVTETFDGVPLPVYLYTNSGHDVYNYQLPPGVNQVGQLKIGIERFSGNLIENGYAFESVNGTNHWRIEASTQNGGTPPVSPAILFDQPVRGFGADWNFLFSDLRTKLIVNGQTLLFSNYVGKGVHFLGIADPGGMSQVEIDVTSPFNVLLSADNVSYAVPEPSALALLLVGGALLGPVVRCHRRRGQ
ncbi:MAG: PEP-CTERM sorting domain-containing protein [Pirellulales bacterium]|nr:PEP-CTERM sorting domain-containing protein [Pirellulales bacterium]